MSPLAILADAAPFEMAAANVPLLTVKAVLPVIVVVHVPSTVSVWFVLTFSVRFPFSTVWMKSPSLIVLGLGVLDRLGQVTGSAFSIPMVMVALFLMISV